MFPSYSECQSSTTPLPGHPRVLQVAVPDESGQTLHGVLPVGVLTMSYAQIVDEIFLPAIHTTRSDVRYLVGEHRFYCRADLCSTICVRHLRRY